MKLHLNSADGQNLFTGYDANPDAGYVAVNGTRYAGSLIVTPARLIQDWNALAFAQLTNAHFEYLRDLQPEIVLLGTGSALRFPKPALSQALANANIGLEVMDTGAACRTYNILTSEGRNVATLILIR